MANRFFSQSPVQPQPPQQQGPFQNGQDAFNQFNQCIQNPRQFLRDRDIDVPDQYADNPEHMARYLLNNLPQNVQQNKVFQVAGMLKNLFGA